MENQSVLDDASIENLGFEDNGKVDDDHFKIASWRHSGLKIELGEYRDDLSKQPEFIIKSDIRGIVFIGTIGDKLELETILKQVVVK